MRFQDIAIPTSQPDTADPRTTPASVPAAQVLAMPSTIPGTDNAPAYFGFVLEGTAADTMTVILWAQAEPSQGFQFDGEAPAPSLRRWYKIGTVVLTVGTMKTLPAVQGTFYLQTTGAPAHDSILRVGAMASVLP